MESASNGIASATSSSSASSARSSMKPLGSLLKVDPTAGEVTNLKDLRGFRIKSNIETGRSSNSEVENVDKMIKDERGREYEQNGAKDEQEVIDVETMEKVRYKLIAASYSYWLSTPRETSSTGHPQDRDHIGMLFSRMDKKRDGIVRVVEVSNTVKDLCPNTTPSQLVVLERLVDTNESGFVRKDEFIKFLKTKITSLPPVKEIKGAENTNDRSNNTRFNAHTESNGDGNISDNDVNVKSQRKIVKGELSILKPEKLEWYGREDDEVGEINDLKEIMDFVQQYKERKRVAASGTGSSVNEDVVGGGSFVSSSPSYTEEDIQMKLQFVLDSTQKHAKRIEELENENILLKSNIDNVPRAVSLDKTADDEGSGDDHAEHNSPAVVLSAPHRFPLLSPPSNSITAVTPIKMASLSSPVHAEHSPLEKRYRHEKSMTTPAAQSPFTPNTNRRGSGSRKYFSKMPYHVHPKQHSIHVGNNIEFKCSSTTPSRSLLGEDNDGTGLPRKSRHLSKENDLISFTNLKVKRYVSLVSDFIIHALSPRYTKIWRVLVVLAFVTYIRLCIYDGNSSTIPASPVHSHVNQTNKSITRKPIQASETQSATSLQKELSSSLKNKLQNPKIITDTQKSSLKFQSTKEKPSLDTTAYTHKYTTYMPSLMSGLPTDIYMKTYHKEDDKNDKSVNSNDKNGLHAPVFHFQNIPDFFGDFGNFLRSKKKRKTLDESNKVKIKEKIFDMLNGLHISLAHWDYHLRPYLNFLQVVTGLELIYYIGHVKMLRRIICSLSGLTAYEQKS